MTAPDRLTDDEMQFGRLPNRSILMAFALSAAGCGGGYAEHVAGQTAHFRLWVDDKLSAPIDVQQTLQGLEGNWSLVGAMLSVPEGYIDYHVATADDIASQCQTIDAQACSVGTAIYSPGTFNQHELNHAYMALRSTHRPALFLIEGLAESVGCYDGAESPPPFADADSWSEVLASTYSGPADVYASGRRLVRYLILNFGVGPLLAYYEQAPSGSDPRAFADNFAQVWGTSLDQAWNAMQSQSTDGTTLVYPVCPCSGLPTLPTPSQQAVSSIPSEPYWTLPDQSNGGALALSTPPHWTVTVSDCDREVVDVSQADLLFTRVSSGFFASADQISSSNGQFLSDTCAGAELYDVSTVDSFGVLLTESASPAPVQYLLLNSSNPRSLQSNTSSLGVCVTCDFSSQNCQPQPIGALVTVSGPTYVSFSVDVSKPVSSNMFTLTP